MTKLIVEHVGVLALLEDRGRSGLAHLGVGRSGAADRASCDLANRLVGNRPDAACIEATLGRLAFRVETSVLVAVTGAPVAIRCGDREQAVNTSFTARAGDTVTLGAPTAGLRTYVAVYVADQYLLGRPSEAKRGLDYALDHGLLFRGKQYLGSPAGSAFAAVLLRDLAKWGYIRSR